MNKIGQIATAYEPLKDDIMPSSGASSGGYTGGQCAGYPAASGPTPINQMSEQSYSETQSKIVSPLDGTTSIGVTDSSPSPQKGSEGIASPFTCPF